MLFKLKVALKIIVENILFALHFKYNFKHSSYEKSLMLLLTFVQVCMTKDILYTSLPKFSDTIEENNFCYCN